MTATKCNPKIVWTGRILSVICTLPFIFASSMKLMMNPEVIKGMAHAGLPENLIRPIGIIEAVCIVVYLCPATSVLGAILFAGFMGGTIITHLLPGETHSAYFHAA